MFKAVIQETTGSRKVRYFSSESAYLAFVDHVEQAAFDRGIFTTRLASSLVITNPGGTVTELRPDETASFIRVDE